MDMKKEYTPTQIEILALEAEDIVTNSLPWLSAGASDSGDAKDLYWSNEK